MSDSIDIVIRGARLAPCDGSIAVVDADAVGIDDGKIVYIGPTRDAPAAERTVELAGQLVTPGLVECHTHLVWAGDRLADFDRRTGGESYVEIAAGGGGILSTVAATAQAGVDVLVAGAERRLRWLQRSGVTTCEVKSGYGMSTEAELRILQAVATASERTGMKVEPTLLGAHATPSDGDRHRQVRRVVEEMIPAVASTGLAVAVDVFVDSIAYDVSEMEEIFEAAATAGLGLKAHVGQIADVGGAGVAGRWGAMSIDHGEHIPPGDIGELADGGTAVVLVPGASLFLREATTPPVQALRDAGVGMAVTTDLNPGSSPLASLPAAAALAVHSFGLTPAEAVSAITMEAAKALRLADGRGSLTVGGPADLAIWDASDPIELAYWLSGPPCLGIAIDGVFRMFERGEEYD